MIVLAVMSKMRSSSLLALVAGLVACDRPTAPQARDAIEAEQHVLLHSDAWRVGPRLGSLFEHITMSGWIPRALGADIVTVDRDGNRIPLSASVIERVYLPPTGSHGRAVSHYSVLLWDPRFTVRFARGAVFLTNDQVSDVELPRRELLQRLDDALALHRSVAMVVDPGGAAVWFGFDGHLEIHPVGAGGQCPFVASHAEGLAEQSGGEVPPDVECTGARYSVSLTSTIRQGDPNDALDVREPFRHHPVVHLDAPVVGGVRIVTHCEPAGPENQLPAACFPLIQFWRDPSQFAPQLVVDLTTMRNDGRFFWTQRAAGAGPNVLPFAGGSVRATVTLPDGRVVQSGLFDHPDSIPWLKRLGLASVVDTRPGARARIVAPMPTLGLGSDRSDYAVLDLDVLPRAKR